MNALSPAFRVHLMPSPWLVSPLYWAPAASSW